MLRNPYEGTLSAPGWGMGWLAGYSNPDVSLPPPLVLAPHLQEPYNVGVLAGQQSASDGVEFGPACLDAPDVEHGPEDDISHGISGAEILHGAWHARHLKNLAGGLAGMAVGLIELAITLQRHTAPPEDVLPSLGEPLMNMLDSLGAPSMELFSGAGMDPISVGCEIRVTPLFKSRGQAKQAVLAMGRQKWLVTSWRTDQSASFRVVESS